jgi:hypothetical protein
MKRQGSKRGREPLSQNTGKAMQPRYSRERDESIRSGRGGSGIHVIDERHLVARPQQAVEYALRMR